MPRRYEGQYDEAWEHPTEAQGSTTRRRPAGNNDIRVTVHDPYYDRYAQDQGRGYEQDPYDRSYRAPAQSPPPQYRRAPPPGRAQPARYVVDVREPYAGTPYYSPPPTAQGSFFRFSTREIGELSISAAILSIAFALTFSSGLTGALANPWGFIWAIPITAVAVSTGFLFHEMAHKYVAQKYGCWAEFRMSVQGLLFALGMAALLGMFFAAPGAVMISGNINRVQNGKISVAGSLVNITLGLIFLPFMIFGGASLIGLMGTYGAMVNFFLAVFNMLPIRMMNLDGYKVFDWDKSVWAGVLGIAIGLLIVSYRFSPCWV